MDNNIIPLCIPAHVSYLLQPLNISCFKSLKGAYGDEIEKLMRASRNYIDKEDFLHIIPDIRNKALTAANIRNGFAAAGIVPISPN